IDEGVVTFEDIGLSNYAHYPVLDAAGNVYFYAQSRPEFETNFEIVPEIWKWHAETGLFELVIAFDDSAIYGFQDVWDEDLQKGTILGFDFQFGFQVSSDGRVAGLGRIPEFNNDSSSKRVVYRRTGFWAQDEEGDWSLLIASHSNPKTVVPPAPPLDEFKAGGENFGRATNISLPGADSLRRISGGEDGLHAAQTWWTDDGLVFFSASFWNEETETVEFAGRFLATVVGGPPGSKATGVRYVWDEGLSTLNWHTIESGDTNWLDANGVRWNKPPTTSSAQVEIPEPFCVELKQAVLEIATLNVGGTLELFANLRVTENTVLHDVTMRGDAELISEGPITVDGDIVAGIHGIRAIWSEPGNTITAKGSIFGIETGIWVTSADGIKIENDADVSSNEVMAILADAQSGNIEITNRNSITSDKSNGIVAIAENGDILINSPGLGEGLMPVVISTGGKGIDAKASGSIDIKFSGKINTIAANNTVVPATGIRAESSSGTVNIESMGMLSTKGDLFQGNGIWVNSQSGITVKHRGSISADGWAVTAESTQGDVLIDAQETFLNAEGGGLQATAPNGKATIYSETINASFSNGIEAKAGGDIEVVSRGAITTMGVKLLVPVSGIYTDTTGGSTMISNTGNIMVTSDSPSPAIYAKAATDITIQNTGRLSSLSGGGIWAESATGTVEINHEGLIGVSGESAGILAKSETGSVIIKSSDPLSWVKTAGGKLSGDAIHASAGGSVSIDWAGEIESTAIGSNAVFAYSETAGVNVTTRGSVNAFGSNADGVLLSGSLILTLNILGGSVSGADGTGTGVRFVDGTDNKLTNHGGISASSMDAIISGNGNETIDNHGIISGNIDLGGGTNALTNHPGSDLVTETEINLGAGNVFDNSGLLQLGEAGEEVVTTVLTGNYIQQSSGTFRVEVEDSDNSDSLTVNGAVTLAGKLNIHLQADHDLQEGDSFELITANSITGTFDSVKVFQGVGPDSQNTVSRSIRFDITYTGTKVTATVVPVTIEDYADWQELFFDEEQAADEEISGPDKNPDGDGLTNREEYVFGGDPLVPDGSPVTFFLNDTANPNELSVSATFDLANDATDAQWFFETSSDLENWIEVGASETGNVDNGDFSQITASLTQPIDVTQRTFLKIGVKEQL
ncbi:MAG: hypothetical protein O7C75_06025, partial [Verrucomicrobia bacterium]|nr:hypothetical protein [Verrucomicrobiota bacterium]